MLELWMKNKPTNFIFDPSAVEKLGAPHLYYFPTILHRPSHPVLQLKIIIRLPEKGFCSLWDHSILGQFGHHRRVAVGPPANARHYCSLLIVPPIYNRASIEKICSFYLKYFWLREWCIKWMNLSVIFLFIRGWKKTGYTTSFEK